MSKHTPEPWRVLDGGCDGGIGIVQTSHVTRDVWEIPRCVEDLYRIVACVNACAGMADPASEIAALKAQRDELLEACKSAIAGFKGVDAGLGKSVVANTGVYRMLLATIAKAEGGAA